MKFEISFPASIHSEPITGRVFLVITRSEQPAPHLQLFDVPFFAVDVRKLMPGVGTAIDGTTPGYPLGSLGEIPAGDYCVQALLNVYTEFHRSDGHTIWAHMDQWEGQDLARSPGNLISDVQKIHLDPQKCSDLKFELNKIIPPVAVPAD